MKDNIEKKGEVFEVCPHCNARLTSWEQVLLKVDRALICKKCWYKIILPPENPLEPLVDEQLIK